MTRQNQNQCCYRENVNLDFPFYDNSQLYNFQYNDANCLNNAELYALFYPELAHHHHHKPACNFDVLAKIFHFDKKASKTEETAADTKTTEQ